jgi:hypothetical protein
MTDGAKDYSYLAGKEHEFPDGIRLKIIQVKQRDTAQWITYEHIYLNALPKRFTQKVYDFIDTYGHLFQDAGN